MALEGIKKAIEEAEASEPNKDYIDKTKVETLKAIIGVLREKLPDDAIKLLPQIVHISL